jgi:hypothetical protein
MKSVIWKFPLKTYDTTVKMPKDAVILCVQMQYNPTLWVIVDSDFDDSQREDRHFVIHVTGEIFDDTGHRYLGTVQDEDGYVLHVFEFVK